MTRKTKGGPSGPRQTPAQKRALGRHRVTVWLEAEDWAALESFAARHPSRAAAVVAAIRAASCMR